MLTLGKSFTGLYTLCEHLTSGAVDVQSGFSEVNSSIASLIRQACFSSSDPMQPSASGQISMFPAGGKSLKTARIEPMLAISSVDSLICFKCWF